MATQQHFSNQTNSSRSRKGPKVNDKGIEMITKKNLLNSVNFLNSSALEIPAVTTNGMKNIEHFIDKTLIESKQWYRCKWQNCTYSTIRSDSIVRHMRKHTGERPYKCWFCSYATIQSSALKIHMRRHTGERPYMCKYENCGKRFAVLNTLVVHERTHTGYKPYKCSFASCNYSSSDRCKLVNHLRKTHQVELDPSKSMNQSVSVPMNSPAFPTILNGDSPSPASSSHSLALVGGAMLPAQLLSTSLMTSYTPFSINNNSQIVMNNGQASGGLNQAKIAGTTSADAFMPLNFLSVVSSSENTQNTQSNTSAFSTTQKKSKRKSAVQRKAVNQSHPEAVGLNGQITLPVNRDENSIKRVMILVDKRIVNNRTKYICKWPSCGYDTLRSDSIVRHIRSHTGERPYKCWYENCNYATIQRSTLKKHLSRHLSSVF